MRQRRIMWVGIQLGLFASKYGPLMQFILVGIKDGSSNIVFCKPFFSLPAASTCDFPSTNNPDMLDRGGAFLHELIHVPALNGGLEIKDGTDNDCYDW